MDRKEGKCVKYIWCISQKQNRQIVTTKIAGLQRGIGELMKEMKCIGQFFWMW